MNYWIRYCEIGQPIQGLQMRQFNNLESKILLDTLKSSASTYESSGSYCSKTTTRIKSGPDALDESRLLMTFLTNLQVREICSFRSVIEGKPGKQDT